MLVLLGFSHYLHFEAKHVAHYLSEVLKNQLIVIHADVNMTMTTIGRIPGSSSPWEHHPPCCKSGRPRLCMAKVASFVMLQRPRFMTNMKSLKLLLVLQLSEGHDKSRKLISLRCSCMPILLSFFLRATVAAFSSRNSPALRQTVNMTPKGPPLAGLRQVHTRSNNGTNCWLHVGFLSAHQWLKSFCSKVAPMSRHLWLALGNSMPCSEVSQPGSYMTNMWCTTAAANVICCQTSLGILSQCNNQLQTFKSRAAPYPGLQHSLLFMNVTSTYSA